METHLPKLILLSSSLLLNSCQDVNKQASYFRVPSLGLHDICVDASEYTTSPPKEPALFLINGSDFIPYVDINFGGIPYSLGYDYDRSIRAIWTDAPNFVTPEGLRVKYDDLDQYYLNVMFEEPGFGTYLVLESGWLAFFGMEENRKELDLDLSKSSIIGFLIRDESYPDAAKIIDVEDSEHSTWW